MDLFDAIGGGDADAVRACLADGADPNAPNEEDELPLVLAAVEDAVDVVQALLDGGADPARSDTAGWTPLFYAVQEDAVEAFTLLLSRVTPEALHGQRLIAVAARSDAARCAEVLCPLVDVDGVDADGRTPLAIAAREAHVEVIEVLLRHGADPNLADAEGQTPLMRATRVGSETVVRMLVAAGAKA